MKYDLVIFDMDGTVLDTLGDLTAALNHALLNNGLPPRTLPEVRSFVGNGIRKLIERGVPSGTGLKRAGFSSMPSQITARPPSAERHVTPASRASSFNVAERR